MIKLCMRIKNNIVIILFITALVKKLTVFSKNQHIQRFLKKKFD